jgi:hypothetical protein
VENLSLEMAYSRYGAGVSSRNRNLSSVASDGSLVLSCFGGRFSRPRLGVMRYDSKISLEAGVSASLNALRGHIESAHSAGTLVHAVMITPGSAATPRRVFVRPDLSGTVVSFDGDHFAVEFMRTEPLEPVKPPSGRRKR